MGEPTLRDVQLVVSKLSGMTLRRARNYVKTLREFADVARRFVTCGAEDRLPSLSETDAKPPRSAAAFLCPAVRQRKRPGIAAEACPHRTIRTRGCALMSDQQSKAAAEL